MAKHKKKSGKKGLQKKKNDAQIKSKSSKPKGSEKIDLEKAISKKSRNQESTGISKWLLVAAAVIIGIIAFGYVFNNGQDTDDTEQPSDNTPSGMVAAEPVKLDLYVMSQCPYGTQAVDIIAPVKEKLGDALDLNIDYILYPETQYAGQEAQYCVEGLCSMHGVPEVKGNIVQLCAMEHAPDKYLDMLTCQNKDARNIPSNWEQCARLNELDVEAIKTCYEGEEGLRLLEESAIRASEAGAQGSPTIVVNDEPYSGSRSETDFLRAICSEFEQDKPEACDDVPEPVEVKAVLLNDERCEECDATNLLAQLKQVFPGIEVERLDYSDEEGQALYEELELEYLPALLFTESVQESANFDRVSRYLQPKGSYLSLRIGAQFDPTAEICDNGIDDTGNGLVDCEDDSCRSEMVCRTEEPENLQVFVMSDCPYGKLALTALHELEANVEGLDYEVHYIASESGDGFSSLHGQYEVDENIVQLCVEEHSPEEWLDYLNCRSQEDIKGTGWQTCAEETGVDVDAVTGCIESDEGEELLREDIQVAQELGISASPTWLANNKYKFGGIDAETVKTEYCKHNEGAEGCDKTLTSNTQAPEGSCG